MMASVYAAASATTSSLPLLWKSREAILPNSCSSSSSRVSSTRLQLNVPVDTAAKCCTSSSGSGTSSCAARTRRRRGRRTCTSNPTTSIPPLLIRDRSRVASSHLIENRQTCCRLGSRSGLQNAVGRQTSIVSQGRQQQRLRRPKAKDDDFEIDDDGGFDVMDLEIDEDEEEDFRDYETDYEAPSTGDISSSRALQRGGDSDTFINTEGEAEETVVAWKINEDEFHKISLLTCDFFIRKVPDPDDDVYDFREMYVTPPDTDTYSIPKVEGNLPKKPVRCTLSEYDVVHTTEPPVDEPRSPLAKTEFEIMKVFLTKHYKDRRAHCENFVLDFEEIYVIDTTTKSFHRAHVQVDVAGGENRDRTVEVLIVRDGGTSFRIILDEDQKSPDEIVQAAHWEKTREAMENYLRGFRDYEISNWF